MPGVSKVQVQRAKGIDLLTYLQANEPGSLKRSGPDEYRLIDHDSLKISNGKWHWFSRDIGGRTALDFLIKVRNMPFVDAVRRLCEQPPISLSQPVYAPSRPSTPAASFELPPCNRDNAKAIAYLRGRGIDREVIDRCIEAGTLYESADTHNCVFAGNDETGKPRHAFMRGTVASFRQDVKGGDKRYGFRLSPPVPSRYVFVFESAIDALSMATLRKLRGEDWKSAHYLALGGTTPLAFLRFINTHLEADHVMLCLDNDHAGLSGMVKIHAEIQADAVLFRCIKQITDLTPTVGKDWNEALQITLGQDKQHTDLSRPHDRTAVLY